MLKLLKNINHHKAPGPDNYIPGRLLKEGAIELSPIFTLLFNSTLHQGKIPSPWKQAHVAPVHKKNSMHDPANYRPISLTSVTCNIIEHIVYSQVINHLDSNGILTDKQFGFRKRHSCETQLLITVQDLAQGLRDKQQIDAVILDISKAFDKVVNRHLLLKLEHYGIRGPTLSWIGDFLTNRTQRIMIGGHSQRQLQGHQEFPKALYSARNYLFAILMTYQPAYYLTSVYLPMTACSTEQYILNKMPSFSKKI